jgi:two-component system, cell cycle sensor histidine kinase and response regulator CckA
MEDRSEVRRLEEQLWRSQRMEAVGRLAGGIAHDFSNILTIILGYTTLMSEHLAAESPDSRNVDGIRKAVDRATSLTRQLLAFSRRQILRPRILWINNVISDLHGLLRRLIGEDIELETDLNSDVGLIRADQSQIEQVLMNLVINARDAMPTGGKITVVTRNAELTEEDAREYPYVIPGPHVMIEVADTGEGMDEDTLAHIFEPFFTTKEPGKGTGLGLATVYGIVKQSGGYIWAFSEPGQGASFRIVLPRVAQVVFEEETLPSVAQPAQGGIEVVLLVEDEDELRLLLKDTLEKRGYTVLEAIDGIDAMHVVREHNGPIHIAVTDMVMPKMGGRALLEELAVLRPETQMLFISGYSNDAAIRRDGLATTIHFLQKPFAPSALADKVRQVLDQDSK